MKILYKITSRSRPRKAAETIQNIKEKAQHSDFLIACSLDLDDPAIDAYKKVLDGEEKTIVFFGLSKCKVDAINRDMDKVEKWDILFNVSDDQRFTVNGFDKIVMEEVHKTGGDCFLHFPDGNVEIPTMSIMDRKYYDRFSYIYHPDYKSLCCDIEAMEVAKQNGRYFFINERIFDHMHPGFRKGKNDKQYKHTQSYHNRDISVFLARQRAGYPIDTILHSQSDEQIVFDIYFNGKTGVLWDFGCNDGLTYSNSHYLLKACGWGGVLLDASETCIRKARSLYPGREDIQFLNLGIAPQSGVFSFHESGNHLGKSDHGLVSSFIKEETARFLPYTEYETKNVRCVDLNEFIGNESVYKRADLISIDVEGMDYSILSQIDLNQTETQVVCVENNGCDAGRFVRYCKKFGLIQIYESSENLVFGRKKIKIPSDSKASGRLDWMRSKFRKIVSQFR